MASKENTTPSKTSTSIQYTPATKNRLCVLCIIYIYYDVVETYEILYVLTFILKVNWDISERQMQRHHIHSDETIWQKLILEKYVWMYLILELVNYEILNEKKMTIIE